MPVRRTFAFHDLGNVVSIVLKVKGKLWDNRK